MDYATRIKSVFDDVKQTERVLSREFLLRFALVVLAASLCWYFLGLDVIPLWVVAYYSVALLEKAVLSMRIDGREAFAFALLWAVSFALASVFAVLPVYIWRLGDDIWRFGAMVLMAGAVLNIFLLRSRNWVLGIAYLLPIHAAIMIIATDFFVPPMGGPAFWSAVALSACLAVYFGVCLWEAHRANRELKETREQFLQAQKVEALGTLTSGVAHDFNNLLSVIQGNLELLEAYPDDAERDTYLTAALTAAQRGAQLTRQLTSYGRKAELWPRQMSPTNILHTLEGMARRVLPANITLDIRRDPTEAAIFTDETLLQSALLNLVINARDAMPSGGTITLRVLNPALPPAKLKLSHSGGFVAFEVTDTGTGIAADVLANIRDPFFTTKPVGQGSGLGLPMVCGFAVQSGGDVDIQSRVGFGTTVRLYLPRSDRAPDTPVTQARPQPTSVSPN